MVYSGLTPQKQPKSYRGGDYDDEMSVSLVEETGVPEGNQQVHLKCTNETKKKDFLWIYIGHGFHLPFTGFLFTIENGFRRVFYPFSIFQCPPGML